MEIGIRTLRSKLSDYVRLASTGEQEFEVCCHGRVLARLVGPDGPAVAEQGPITESASPTQEPSDHFSANLFVVEELKRIVADKLRELDQLSHAELQAQFHNSTGVFSHPYFADRDMKIAIARLFQLKLWTERFGGIPADIAERDTTFWLRLLALCAAKAPMEER